MTKTTTRNAVQKDLQRAEELMTLYAETKRKHVALTDTIKDELHHYAETMEQAETELLEIGERNKALFDNDNLHLQDGYLHIAHNSVIETTQKFNWPDFLEQKGDLVKLDFEKAKMKKEWNNTDKHNELIALGVQVNTVATMQVKLGKTS
jgi:hypothetical protein